MGKAEVVNKCCKGMPAPATAHSRLQQFYGALLFHERLKELSEVQALDDAHDRIETPEWLLVSGEVYLCQLVNSQQNVEQRCLQQDVVTSKSKQQLIAI